MPKYTSSIKSQSNTQKATKAQNSLSSEEISKGNLFVFTIYSESKLNFVTSLIGFTASAAPVKTKQSLKGCSNRNRYKTMFILIQFSCYTTYTVINDDLLSGVPHCIFVRRTVLPRL